MDSTPLLVLDEDQAIESLAFLITAARIQLDEPASYGPMRLLTAAERLSSFMESKVSPETKAFLGSFMMEIDEAQDLISGSVDYANALDGLCRDIAEHLVARSSLKDARK